MKRKMGSVFPVVLAVLLVVGLLAACGKNTNEGAGSSAPASGTKDIGAPTATAPAGQQGYKDGLYYAEGEYDAKSGWKDVVALKVEAGKIVVVNWNGLHKDGGLDKKTASEKGFYGMKKAGAVAEWHEQAVKAEQYLLEKQDPKAIVVKDDGSTDAISGVSIHVGGFVQLAEQALAAGTVESGPYKDGTYFAEGAEFDAKSGWKENVTITVINGKIAAVSWNGTHKDGGTDKATRSKSGEYGMKKGGASSEWHEQTAKAEQYLLEKQDPKAIVVKEDGKTDAISGVSIHVGDFAGLVAQALEGAR